MANWNEGVISDIAARPRFARETTPIWLVTACTLLGCRAPDLSKPFRYADLGCGAGFSALVVAACCPRGEVWGFDFNPASIEIARDLAARAGLTNAHFTEASFAELAVAAPREFDFMVAESVVDQLSPENQAHVYGAIGRHLRPGGLAYLGYRADTGWSEFAPVQTLMRMQFDRGIDVSDFAVTQGFEYIDRLRSGGAAYFARNPGAARRIDEIRPLPAGDVALEFLNRDWHALMFADVADAMAEAKCEFLGRATLHENVAVASVPPAMLPLMDLAPSIRVRETMQDVAAATAYRRDIYRRGLTFPPVAEHRSRLAALTVAACSDDDMPLPTWQGPVPADAALYQPVIQALRNGPLTVGHAHTLGALVDGSLEAAADVVAMLIASGMAHPIMPDLIVHEASVTVARLNDAIIDAVTLGEELDYLVSPRLGTAVESNALEVLTIGALLYGRDPDDLDGLASSVLAAMRRGGRSVTREGLTVEDDAAAQVILRDVVEYIVQHRAPLFRDLGVLRG